MKLSFYPSTVTEDMALCLCVSYVSACAGRDDFIPDEAAGALRGAAAVLVLVCWFVMSFLNGLRMRKRFALGMCLWLTLPPAIQLGVSGIRVIKFSDIGLAADKLCLIISRLPFAELEKAMGINGNIFSVMTAVLGLMLFGAGYLYTKKMIQGCERNDIL
ncbi:MAG: hypothetical protein ACI4J0_00970 [Huintestinicola sp.]|uniref:hypothetical protein n=1 Tax=Huintestinicola sp. TaxID=2981661 RepID=UPI003F05F60E